MAQRRNYSLAFKRTAVQQLADGRRSAAHIERELGITPGLLRRWQRQTRQPAAADPNRQTVMSNPDVPTSLSTQPAIDLKNPSLYINRELSQIEFNQRVLRESINPRHPLLERLKFIAIFASNMDEFFMVRVSGLKQQVLAGVTDAPADGLTPREQLVAIHRITTKLVDDEMRFYSEMRELLNAQGVQIRNYHDLKPTRQRKLRQYFEQEIYPTLTPLAFDPSHPFPHISNLSLNLAVVIRDPDSGVTRFARIKVPATLPRLVPLRRVAPDDLLQPTAQRFVWLEQVIMANLDRLFPGMEIVEAYPFRITRNNDMEIQEEEADDLLMTIEENLRQRHFGSVVRLEVDESMPESVRSVLMRNFEIGAYDVYTVAGPLALSSLWELHKLERPDLKDEPYYAKHPPSLRTGEDIFTILRRQDVLIHRPYDTFRDVAEFIEAAAEDEDVLTIKITLYRVGPNPVVVNALMRARENGKQVAVLVELKARFDEASNISWARALERAGVHVVYGVMGLKTHAKVALVVRREAAGLRRYLHLSTGNYNAITARIYTDLDFLTSDDDMGADATDFFNFLTGFSKQRAFRKFLVAPVSLRQRLAALIEQEATLGANGRIIIKCNSIVDAALIRALYRASQAGTRIDLIVRGICCLRPGIEGVSDNIRVLSIVGRYLEHSRIYYFHNEGQPIIYTGSADLMPRNLDRRVEVVFPIEDPVLQAEVIENLLDVQLADTQQAHWLRNDGTYEPALLGVTEGEAPFSSQDWLMHGRKSLQVPARSEV